MSSHSTVQDALIAELLGEVGQLYEKVHAIKSDITETCDALKTQQETNGVYIEESVRRSVEVVTGALQDEQKKLDAVLRMNKQDHINLQNNARAVIRAEIPRMRAEFHQVASEVLMEANGLVYAKFKRRKLVIFSMVGFLLFSTGCFVGARYLSGPGKTVVSDSGDSKSTKEVTQEKK